MPNLILIRGLPGSGKSTLAKTFSGYTHVENDMFLMEDGQYVFTAKRRKKAVRLCIASTANAMAQGKDVVVSNCFLDRRSMDVYHDMARMYGYNLQEIVADGNFQNVHGVPEHMMEIMRERWED